MRRVSTPSSFPLPPTFAIEAKSFGWDPCPTRPMPLSIPLTKSCHALHRPPCITPTLLPNNNPSVPTMPLSKNTTSVCFETCFGYSKLNELTRSTSRCEVSHFHHTVYYLEPKKNITFQSNHTTNIQPHGTLGEVDNATTPGEAVEDTGKRHPFVFFRITDAFKSNIQR